MTGKIVLGQLDPDGEALDTNDDTGCFLNDVVAKSPFARRQYAQSVGSKDDAEYQGQRRLREMETVANEAREEGIEDEK